MVPSLAGSWIPSSLGGMCGRVATFSSRLNGFAPPAMAGWVGYWYCCTAGAAAAAAGAAAVAGAEDGLVFAGLLFAGSAADAVVNGALSRAARKEQNIILDRRFM